MPFAVIGNGRFTTGRSDGPSIQIHGVADTPLELELKYDVPVAGSSRFESARLVFRSVFEYRWIDADQIYFLANEGDFEYDLIEIFESEYVERMVSFGMYRNQPVSQRMGGVIDERSVRHFRIGWDHYGAFDILCLDVDLFIGTERATPSPQAS